MNVAALDDILTPGKLDRKLLHVFVAGPGEGEGILVALPNAGWIAIDGCAVRGDGCLSALLSTWQRKGGSDADPLELLVFTHPHEDHAAGIPDLIERHRPREILVTGSTPVGPSLVEQAEGLIRSMKTSLTEQSLARRHAKAALVAIARWAEDNPKGLLSGADGLKRKWGQTECFVRAPHESQHLRDVLSEIASGTLTRANEASLVLELVVGKTRIVFGGDLPRMRTSSSSTVPTGWDSVMGRHDHLGDHSGLKIAHHGSEHAQHPDLLVGHESAVWFVTAFAKQRLPRTFDPGGLPALVEKRPIHATSPSADVDVPASADRAEVPIGSLQRRGLLGTDLVLAGSVEVTPREHPDARAPVWGVAFDDTGSVRGLWRGASAIRVVA